MQVKRDNSDRKQIRFGELLEQIDEARGKTPLATWVKQACKEKLNRDSK
ncbi:DUF3950 domain-containing protein [Shewanella aestuarii]|uniref:DUF3950 domain-containing protein n=1 Tax=Shewanella aestuarii TaxID=1028752 RepID=A0A6G9QQA7_9GAMM|nr:DUF3950 domain-containing protein [Shewanella aestuarii]QIR16652.1 DUF3950 domain-containing protein [Shewanella aestuarii]